MDIKTNNDIFFIIWTTTPWTLPANQAIAIGNKIEYVLANVGDKSIIVAKDLLEPLLAKLSLKPIKIIRSIEGKELLGLKAQHPFYNKEVPIINADHVTTENGTGLVHIAPGMVKMTTLQA